MKELKGLTSKEVKELQEKYGKNELSLEKHKPFIFKIFEILCEPMFILLIIASLIYFVLGEPRDGIIMLIFVIGIIMIDIIQEWKTDKTLKALKDLSEPKVTVLRDGKKVEILSSNLVPGDIIFICEGEKIPADGYVLKCNGLCIDESSLTGESVGVFKTTEDDNNDSYFKTNYCYQGTLVQLGTGVIKVDKIGNNTEYGKIGKSIDSAKELQTPLQVQIDKLVMSCAVVAFILFVLVGIFTFFNLDELELKERIIESILSGITLAMAMIPEEFPVVLTVFLSMGAWRLAKKNSLIKKLPAVETLGAVSVLCVDKTGTITKNQMEVIDVVTKNKEELAYIMTLCCEEETYDSMEHAMFNYASKLKISKKEILKHKTYKNYPFDNDTKIVGAIREYKNEKVLCVKGSPETVMNLCGINMDKEIEEMEKKGLRVIAVAKKIIKKELENLIDYKLDFVGLVGLIDPPKDNIEKDIEICNKAGVRVIMITGDNGITASTIAKSIGIKNADNIITGKELEEMTFEELKEKVKKTSIFSRVIPEHKMKIVKALQANNEIVGMTGDGVNDAPALKQANIGIAMGMRGSEVSREASDLVLLDDNFHTIVSTIEDARRIYDNIKKAIGYIFVIHIPIALSSLIGPMIGIEPASLMLLPLHVVLLELVIDPTCSIVLERQPHEANIMNIPPRDAKKPIVDKRILFKSILQGLIIFLSSFITYYLLLNNTGNQALARTMGLLIIVISNIFLVQEISSDYDYMITTFFKLVKDKVLIFITFAIIIIFMTIIYSPLNEIFKLQFLTFTQLLLVILISFISVIWYDFVKLIKRNK